MLAMHYRIDLPDAAAVVRLRQRAAERGPLFDGMPGLHLKLFLVDPEQPCYATFYLWRDADAALAFLQGAFFADLSKTFGRPKVRLLLTEATELPFVAGEHVVLDQRPRSDLRDGACVEAVDPLDGELLTLGADGTPGRRFEVMYRAIGAQWPT